MNTQTVVSGSPYADTADPTVNVLWLGQAGIGLPDRDYYTKTDAKSEDLRKEYLLHVERMLVLFEVRLRIL